MSDVLDLDFTLCTSCAAQSDSVHYPGTCRGCKHNRAVIEHLRSIAMRAAPHSAKSPVSRLVVAGDHPFTTSTVTFAAHADGVVTVLDEHIVRERRPDRP